MENLVQLEIAIGTNDEESVNEIKAVLAEINPEVWPQTREVLTIITVVASAVALVNNLLTLKKKIDELKAGADSTTIIVKNIDRSEINLLDANEESLKSLIDAGESENVRDHSGRA